MHIFSASMWRTPSAKIRGRHLHRSEDAICQQDAHLLSKHVEEIIDNAKDSDSKMEKCLKNIGVEQNKNIVVEKGTMSCRAFEQLFAV